MNQNEDGFTLEYDTPIATGTAVKVIKNSEVYTKSFMVVIFGDVNNDGVIDEFDVDLPEQGEVKFDKYRKMWYTAKVRYMVLRGLTRVTRFATIIASKQSVIYLRLFVKSFCTVL